MRQIFALLTILTLCSCGQQNEQTKTTPVIVSDDSSNKSDNSVTSEKTESKPVSDWQQYQDSLRNEILKSKESEILKRSFLQEMYIRNVVTISNDSLRFLIPFNLHGPDCGAPDCYSTDISFSFKFGDTVIFPKNLSFQEHEHGCIDKEMHLSGNFKLFEQTDKHIIYHSNQHKRTLVLFSSNEYTETTAFYFTGVKKNKINGKNIYTIADVTDENFSEKDYPFTSWILTTNEYENFIH
ncbi:MAG: hypothetical protein WDZ35_02360 [Crocinitomicaceae bacterium]